MNQYFIKKKGKTEIKRTGSYWGNWDKIEAKIIRAEESGDKIDERWVLFLFPSVPHQTDSTATYSDM